MDKSRLELKVGAFVFVGIFILAAFVFKIGNIRNYGSVYSMRFIFSNVCGVQSGSPVRFSGVEVGEVTQVNILEGKQDNTIQIEVLARIKKSILVPSGSKAYIETLGLLGEKYIEIIPPSEFKTFLKPGDTLFGNTPLMMHELVSSGQQLVKDLQEIVHKLKAGEGTVGMLLNDDKLYQELEGLISDIRQAEQGTVGRLLYDDTLYQELEALISDIRRHPWKLFWKTSEKKKR